MKKVIGGKAYNTETATAICWNVRHYGNAYLKGVEEYLYRTSKGALFLHVEFGVEASWYDSILSKWYPNGEFGSHTGTEIIVVPTEEQARKFVEKFGSHDDFVMCFGEPEEA
jgi:hypothetical protein